MSKGENALVTGGAVGIGRSIVLALVAQGADVVVADLDLDAARKTAAEVEGLGGPEPRQPGGHRRRREPPRGHPPEIGLRTESAILVNRVAASPAAPGCSICRRRA